MIQAAEVHHRWHRLSRQEKAWIHRVTDITAACEHEKAITRVKATGISNSLIRIAFNSPNLARTVSQILHFHLTDFKEDLAEQEQLGFLQSNLEPQDTHSDSESQAN